MNCGNCKFGVTVIDHNVFRMGEGGGRINDHAVTSCRLNPKWQEFEHDHYCFQHKVDVGRSFQQMVGYQTSA